MQLESRGGTEKRVQIWRLRTECDVISLRIQITERRAKQWGCVNKHSQGTSGQQGALDSGCMMLLRM